jgi:hypothetical protein
MTENQNYYWVKGWQYSFENAKLNLEENLRIAISLYYQKFLCYPQCLVLNPAHKDEETPNLDTPIHYDNYIQPNTVTAPLEDKPNDNPTANHDPTQYKEIKYSPAIPDNLQTAMQSKGHRQLSMFESPDYRQNA